MLIFTVSPDIGATSSITSDLIWRLVYPIILEVNKKVSHISLSKLENIPLIKFPKYPISLEVNKNIPEITNTK